MPVRHEGAGLPRLEDRSGLRRGLDAPPELINHFLIATLDRDARRDWSGNSLSRRPEGDNAQRVSDGSPSTLWSDTRGGAWSRSGPRGERCQGWDTSNKGNAAGQGRMSLYDSPPGSARTESMDASADVIRDPEGDGRPKASNPVRSLGPPANRRGQSRAQRRPRAGLFGPVHRRGRNAARA